MEFKEWDDINKPSIPDMIASGGMVYDIAKERLDVWSAALLNLPTCESCKSWVRRVVNGKEYDYGDCNNYDHTNEFLDVDSGYNFGTYKGARLGCHSKIEELRKDNDG